MAVGRLAETMYRERPHSIRLQLLLASSGEPVSAPLASYTHRLIGKLSHADADADAIFDLTNIFTNEDDTEKIVAALIPASATDSADLPEDRPTRIYLQWQTNDGVNPWIVADGHLTVMSSLPRTA